MENNERILKMSLEAARKLWKECIVNDWIGIADALRENFTKEELEDKKGFTWEESFNGEGYSINENLSDVKQVVILLGNKYPTKGVFKTEKQALSALAFAQLSHIVAKYNEKDTGDRFDIPYSVTVSSGGRLELQCNVMCQLFFKRKEDAKTSMEVNAELWKQYWML